MKLSLYDYCLAEGREQLLDQWDGEVNAGLGLDAQSVARASRSKVWWRCEKGHSWFASVRSRTSLDNGCPYCAGKKAVAGENDLASLYPAIAAELHPTLNGELDPSTVSASSNRRLWWTCEKGHEYQTSVAHRTREGSGCPYCSGKRVLAGFNDLATTEPRIAAQWHSALNGSLTPQTLSAGSHAKVWWQCAEGHVWQSAVFSRTGAKKCGCPVCAGRKNAFAPRYSETK